MDLSDPIQRRTFFQVHQGLPREGPGNTQSTLKALELARPSADWGDPVQVVDVACGPGMQTLDLISALPGARILALDLHEDFLRDLGQRAAGTAADAHVAPVRGDMRHLPLRDAAADLVWCEGAAYIMGVEQALETWWRLLRPGGVCAFTEAVWLRVDPPPPVRACWAEYPAMADLEACRGLIRRVGYELLGHFVLPGEAWWDDYYGPMSGRIEALAASDPEPGAAAVLAECRQEIDIWRRFGDWYGYAFFVARKP